MTLAEARDKIRAIIAEPTPSFWSDEEINTALNLAKDDLQEAIMTTNKDMFSKNFLINTVEDENDYELPSDFRELKLIRDIDGYDIQFVQVDMSEKVFVEALNVQYKNDNPGSVVNVYYDVFQDLDNKWYLRIAPSLPSGIRIKIDYKAQIPDLKDDNDTFGALNDFMGYIIEKALYYVLSKGPSGDYQNHLNASEMKLNRILGSLRINTSGTEFVRGYLED